MTEPNEREKNKKKGRIVSRELGSFLMLCLVCGWQIPDSVPPLLHYAAHPILMRAFGDHKHTVFPPSNIAFWPRSKSSQAKAMATITPPIGTGFFTLS